jgi:hypothetical protein
MIEQLAYAGRWPRWLERWVVPILIFSLAFLPRAIYPVSRSMLWYYRAIRFSDALLARDWAGTHQSYHPGVTTTWLSGIGIKLFAWQRGLSSAQLMRHVPTQPGTVNGAVVAGVVPLALGIALCVTLSYVLLRRITDGSVALVGGCLLALDPFHLTSSKVLHVDAMLATLMFVSVLFLLNYVNGAKRPDLLWSGVFAGLAFLSKSPSFFLVPYAALVVGVGWIAHLGPGFGVVTGWRGGVQGLWREARVLLVWGGVAVVVFILLWPAVWVEPLDVLSRMIRRVVFHVEASHFNPVFFNGRITYDDPGLPFYLATVVWKTTLITLPMACIALAFAAFRFRQAKVSGIAWLLAAYAVFFTLQMGLSERKELRYLLPVFPALDVLAALGLVESVRAIGRVRPLQEWRWLPTALIAVALILQAGTVLRHHPYYGTHHNVLLGGSRVAQHVLPLQDQGEGLDLAARYLNTLPRAQQSRALIHPLGAEIFERTFMGFTTPFRDPWINYRIYYVNQVMRRLDSEDWEGAWKDDRQNAPLWSVAFDGVTYVWVYGAPPGELAPGGPEYDVSYRLGEHITLERFRLSFETLVPGSSLTVVLIWKTDQEIPENYMVFCHVTSIKGELVAQRDGPPIYGVRPTPSWRAGEVIEDSYEIFLGDDLSPGEYELSVGMYAPESLERLPVYDATGERLPEDRIPLGSLLVQAPDMPDVSSQ